MSFEPFDLFSDIAAPVVNSGPEAKAAVMSFVPRPWGLYRNGLKRLVDVALVLLAVPFVVPVVLVIALMILVQDGHAPFYLSDRVGRNGRVFRMLKLRTMVHDADDLLAHHLATDPEAAAEWKATQKLKFDPRITRFGRILRKSSLDELPQLWNVLRGDMALVGPRPMMPNQRRLYPGLAYYALRPGVTEPWQVSDRNDSTFARRADFDLEYHSTLSFASDVKLILLTISVVLRCTGY